MSFYDEREELRRALDEFVAELGRALPLPRWLNELATRFFDPETGRARPVRLWLGRPRRPEVLGEVLSGCESAQDRRQRCGG